MINILAIIPARSGSKGIKNKNIKLFNDKPLIYWSIKNAIDKSLSLEFKSSLKDMINPYEKKNTAVAIADILTKIEIPESIKKTFYDLKQ